MTSTSRSKQLAFRLPYALVSQLEDCLSQFGSLDLSVTRAELVRMLLNHALEDIRGDVSKLVKPKRKRR